MKRLVLGVVLGIDAAIVTHDLVHHTVHGNTYFLVGVIVAAIFVFGGAG